MRTLYKDADKDGYGNPDTKKVECIKQKTMENGPQEIETEPKRIDLKSLGATVVAEFSNDRNNKFAKNLIDDGK